MHHDPILQPSVRARHGSDARDLLSGVQVAPFHERTPIHTIPQDAVLPQYQDVARRFGFGVRECGPGHKRTLRAVLMADRAHIIAALALHLAPGIDISHVFAAAASHAHAHPDLYEYVRLTPPALLVWLAREEHGATTEWWPCCGSLGRGSLRDITKPVAFLEKRQVQTTRGFR